MLYTLSLLNRTLFLLRDAADLPHAVNASYVSRDVMLIAIDHLIVNKLIDILRHRMHAWVGASLAITTIMVHVRRLQILDEVECARLYSAPELFERISLLGHGVATIINDDVEVASCLLDELSQESPVGLIPSKDGSAGCLVFPFFRTSSIVLDVIKVDVREEL